MKNDPGEFTNQANNSEYSSVLEMMQQRLMAKRNLAGFARHQETIVGTNKGPGIGNGNNK